MQALPGTIRGAFSRLVKGLAEDPGVQALGLFGSWVRGEATATSDFDILVVERSGLDYEYNKLEVQDGLVMDLHHVPSEWMREPVNPQMDHRLHETIVLHDPGRALGEAKEFLERSYMSPRRVEVRTDGLLATAEMHLSRASAAFGKRDPETASAYVGAGLMSAVTALLDIAGVPVTRRTFVWNLRRSCVKLGMEDVYRDFLNMSGVSRVDPQGVSETVEKMEVVWDKVSSFVSENGRALNELHGKVRRDVEYLTSGLIIEGVMSRIQEMLAVDNIAEALVFLRGWTLPMLEGYAWVVSAVAGEKYDYTSLFRVVEGDVRNGSLEALGLSEVTLRAAGDALVAVRRLVGNLRLDRRRLVDSYVS
jgi:predicted nucleotidyltransferase